MEAPRIDSSPQNGPKDDSSLVPIVFRVMSWFGKISLLYQIQRRFPYIRDSYAFVDKYAITHFTAALTILLLSPTKWIYWWEWAVLAYAAFRIFELFIFHVNQLLFADYGPYKQLPPLASHRRTIILLLFNYAELICWFAILYTNIPSRFSGVDLTSRLVAVSLSFFCLSSFGISQAAPADGISLGAVVLESAFGLFMTIAVFARFFAYLDIPARRNEDGTQ